MSDVLEFRTRNFFLAAWLAYKKASYRKDHELKLSRVENGDFVFADPDGCGPKLAREFHTTNPVVRVKAFQRELHHLIDHYNYWGQNQNPPRHPLIGELL